LNCEGSWRRALPTRRALSALAALAALATSALACAGDEDPPVAPEVCGRHAFQEGASARVFAVQPKISPAHFESLDAYRGHLKGLVDKNIKPCLSADRANLIAFPEDIGLPAAFLGSRGKKARSADFIAEAFFYLGDSYAAPIDHYRSLWPDLELAEALQLGLTDTIWRAFYETMRDIAVETGAHVIASANVSGSIEKSDDPAEIAALGDPDLPGAPYVYVARDRALYNAAFVFAPSGEIVARARKPYLVEAEEKDLLLSYGALREVAPIDLGFAKIGVLTSKDAWMPDMVDRLAALGANVIVQPEAFSGWGIEEEPGDWLPDVFLQSGWTAVQKHGAYRYAIIPHLTGNLFDQIFDGQSAIVGDAAPGEAIHAYIGQESQGGFLAVAPWVEEDPSNLSLEERRALLKMTGAALAPGGSNENGYIETVVAANINAQAPFAIEPDGEPGALGKSSLIAESPSGEQVAPALASDGSENVVLAWQDDRNGTPNIYLARSPDAGATFGNAAQLSPSPNAQITPAVVATGTFVYAAWQELDPITGSRILTSFSADAGATFTKPVPASGAASEPLDEWKPTLAASPSGLVVLAFVSGSNGNERVLCGRSTAGSIAWQITPCDGGPPAFEGLNIRNNQWAPAVAINNTNGEVAVAWTDFRAYNWDIVLARSQDGGLSFSSASRIDDGTDARERLHNDPALLFSLNGSLLAAWTDVRLRRAPSKARVAQAPPGSIAPSLELGSAPPNAHAYRPRLASTDAGAVLAVWQDFRSQSGGIYLALSTDAGASFGPEMRIDDGGHPLAPSIAPLPGGKAIIAWEDTRSGARRIRFVTGKP
jgi:predicted amidohydrolase